MLNKNISKIINFIKYNNTFVLILFFFFIFGFGAFASETGKEIIGTETKKIEGEDNSLLLEADLSNFDMNFEVQKIEKDDEFYYITYTFFDFIKEKKAWQYELKENIRRFSIKRSNNLAEILAEELKEEQDARLKELKKIQEKAKEEGPKKREIVKEYSGILGKVFDGAEKVLPNFKSRIKEEMLPPISLSQVMASNDRLRNKEKNENISVSDNLTDVYNKYIRENDIDRDDVFGENDNCPTVYNPGQLDSDGDSLGDACDLNPIKGDADGVLVEGEDAEEYEEESQSSETEAGETEENNNPATEAGETEEENNNPATETEEDNEEPSTPTSDESKTESSEEIEEDSSRGSTPGAPEVEPLESGENGEEEPTSVSQDNSSDTTKKDGVVIEEPSEESQIIVEIIE